MTKNKERINCSAFDVPSIQRRASFHWHAVVSYWCTFIGMPSLECRHVLSITFRIVNKLDEDKNPARSKGLSPHKDEFQMRLVHVYSFIQMRRTSVESTIFSKTRRKNNDHDKTSTRPSSFLNFSSSDMLLR